MCQKFLLRITCHTPQKFVEKTFVTLHKPVKVAKLFSLESFPLYGSLQSRFAKFSWKTVLVKSWRVWLIAVVLLNSLFAVCFPYNSVLGKHTHYRVSAQAPHFKGSASIQMYAIFIPGKHPCGLKLCYVPMGVSVYRT